MKKNIDKIIVIIVCFIIGIILVILNLGNNWYNFNADAHRTDITLTAWIRTEDFRNCIFGLLNDLGICLIASALFLVMVNWSLNSIEERIKYESELKQNRQDVVYGMRVSPLETVVKFASFKNSHLYDNQFFAACIWKDMNLDSINFSGSDLSKVNFTNSSLIEVDFRGCIFNDTIFEGAKCSSANFSKSNITEEQLRTVHSLWNSIMPDGKMYDGRFMLQGDIEDAKQYGYDIKNNPDDKARYFNTNKPE